MKDNCGCASKNEAPGLTRRTFLVWATGALGGVIASVLGATGLTYFASPAFKKDEEEWVDIGNAADIKPGEPLKTDFVARKRDAWVVTEKRSSAWILTDDKKNFTVFDPRCTHLGCPYRWDSERRQFLCPCHSAVFGPQGEVVAGPPPRPLDRYPVKIVGGRLLIRPQPVRKES